MRAVQEGAKRHLQVVWGALQAEAIRSGAHERWESLGYSKRPKGWNTPIIKAPLFTETEGCGLHAGGASPPARLFLAPLGAAVQRWRARFGLVQ